MGQEDRQRWTSVIKPRSGWFDISFRELWQYRDLILLFVRRDFVAIYKQTILGPVWFLIQPLLTTLMFTIVFGVIAQLPTNGVPHVLFYLSGVVCWNYFATCLQKTSDTFIANASIFGKVYFPRLAVPVSVVLTNLITLSIQFLLFTAVLAYYLFTDGSVRPGIGIAIFPLLVVQMAALGLGTGILVSSLTTKYRDLVYLVAFGVQLWMYATPVVYPLSAVPQKWQWLYALNPMTAIVETSRRAFLGAGGVEPWQGALSVGVTLVILLVGVLLFSRIEKTFMDTV